MARYAFYGAVALLILAAPTATIGKPPGQVQDAQVLKKGLNAVALAANSQSQNPPPKTKDNDQGDDHASQNAILKVCTKDTPAARRSAICNNFVSPE